MAARRTPGAATPVARGIIHHCLPGRVLLIMLDVAIPGNPGRPIQLAMNPPKEVRTAFKKIPEAERDNILCLIASENGRFGSLKRRPVSARASPPWVKRRTKHDITIVLKGDGCCSE